MDIVVKGRHTDVPERFREHVAEKLTKLTKLDSKIIRVEVELSKERNPRQADQSDRVELTLHAKGPIIRAEAAAPEKHAALDLAVDKLMARMRKAADRRRVHHGNRTPVSVAAATAPLNGRTESLESSVPEQPAQTAAEPVASTATTSAPTAPSAPAVDEEPGVYVERNGPMVVREKTHKATPMTRDQALYEMELVGHDFFLFVDAESKMPSVVYRRHGYDYGVIRLDV